MFKNLQNCFFNELLTICSNICMLYILSIPQNHYCDPLPRFTLPNVRHASPLLFRTWVSSHKKGFFRFVLTAQSESEREEKKKFWWRRPQKSGLPGSKKNLMQNFTVSSFKKGQVLINENKDRIKAQFFFENLLK